MNTLDTLEAKPLERQESEAQPASGIIYSKLDAATAIKLLESLDEYDEAEQRETWEYLKRVLDEDRLSDRKLFP